ncbi:MAG TPA: dTMP kinase, partial [Cupriavidus sp.]|nr:dTMP kinase [Cupriavidus sp.]
FEAESRAFFERTRTEYLRRAAEAPQRFRVIDATRSIDEIRVTLEEILATL